MFHAETECHRRGNQFLTINLMFLVHQVEQFRPSTEQAFGISYHQEACGVKSVMKHGNHPLLQGRPHINEYVAATDKVHPGERRVVTYILRGEDTQTADRPD